jgi:arylsulfatase A-like enzyme
MNFIFIMSDSFRFDNLACYTRKTPRFRTKKREVATPNLDRFAQHATVFERAYAGSYPTIPNRKDIFTGKMFPFNPWGPLPTDSDTFVRMLKGAGYVTQLIQDTPHTLKNGFNFDRDFDGWEWIRGQEGDRLACEPVAEPGDPEKTRQNGAWGLHMAALEMTRRSEQDCYCAQTMTKAAKWLERNHNKEKFLLFIDTFDPHEPWDAPQWYEDQYDPGYDGIAYRYPVYGKCHVFSKKELNHVRACYAGEVTLVDRWIGYLLETVERMGLMEDTCVIFTADHGICVGDHGWTGKDFNPLYDEIARIPLIIHLPGQARSRRVSPLVQPVDLTATILDLVGIKPPHELDGLSLRPGLEGKSLKTRRHVFSAGDRNLRVASRDWALIYPSAKLTGPKSRTPQLFHLAADPLQKRNVLKGNVDQARSLWDAYQARMKKAGLSVNEVLSPRP